MKSHLHVGFVYLFIFEKEMMKKFILFSLIATSAVASTSALAQQQNYYAGVSLGSSKYDVEVAGATNASDFGRHLGGKIFGGYDFSNMIGAEVGYAYFGKDDARYSVGAVTSEVDAKVHAIYLAVKGTVPLDETYAIFGKAGATFNRLKLSSSSTLPALDDTTDKTSFYGGIGVSYNLQNNLSLTLEHEYFGKLNDEGGKVNYTSLGARYKF